MTKKPSKQAVKDIAPIVFKFNLIKKLQTLSEESDDIAGYIDCNINYGRALGYAEGKHSAYNDILQRIFEGEFDMDFCFGEGEDNANNK